MSSSWDQLQATVEGGPPREIASTLRGRLPDDLNPFHIDRLLMVSISRYPQLGHEVDTVLSWLIDKALFHFQEPCGDPKSGLALCEEAFSFRKPELALQITRWSDFSSKDIGSLFCQALSWGVTKSWILRLTHGHSLPSQYEAYSGGNLLHVVAQLPQVWDAGDALLWIYTQAPSPRQKDLEGYTPIERLAETLCRSQVLPSRSLSAPEPLTQLFRGLGVSGDTQSIGRICLQYGNLDALRMLIAEGLLFPSSSETAELRESAIKHAEQEFMYSGNGPDYRLAHEISSIRFD